MANSGLHPPGWYHAEGDPPGSRRWWDGAKWVGGPAAPGYTDPFLAPQPAMYRSPAYRPMRMDPRPLAGFWVRFGAYLVDSLLLGFWTGALVMIGVLTVPTETQICTDFDGAPYLCSQPTAGGWLIILSLAVAWFLGPAAYHVLLVAKSGQTLGKRAVGVAVVDQWTGQPIGFGRALGRHAGATFISANICWLGYLWAAWDKDKQTWHDKMTSSVVVHVGDYGTWPPSAVAVQGVAL